MRVWRLGVAAAAGGMLSAGAHAAVIATLVFAQPTGTANVTDTIPVEMMLSLDPLSDPLITDGSAHVTSGYNLADVLANLFGSLPPSLDPTQVTADYTDGDLYGIINNAFGCSGTFVTGCAGPPYDFNFNFQSANGPVGPNDSLFVASNLDIEPGTSVTFLFGSFAPTGGVAPAGTYTF